MQEKFPNANSKQNLDKPSKKGARTRSILGSLRLGSTPPYRQKRSISQCVKINSSGFNLLEIVLAIVLFGIAIPVVGKVFGTAFQQEAENTNQEQAIFLASGLMDEISERRFRESSGSPGNCAEAGEISSYDRKGFDDIDDYSIFENNCAGVSAWGPLNPPRDENGNSLTDYAKFSQSVSIYNIASPSSGPTERTNFDPVAEGTTDFKMVTVTIAWNNARNSIQLHKVFARH